MSEPVSLYSMRRYITDSDVDFARRQRPSSMFGMFQDIAALHAENLGAAVDWLYRELNVAWILMRVRIEIDQYPKLARDITVETWPQDPRALYDRDYRILDLDGKTLVRAASTWVIMNLATREIKRDKFLDYFGLETKKERALGKGLGRLKPIADAEIVYEKEIKFSDVDYNNHANNAKYADYVMDAFSFEEHRANTLKAIEIHYINELSPGGILQIRRKTLENGSVYIDGVRKADGVSVFNAMTAWGASESVNV